MGRGRRRRAKPVTCAAVIAAGRRAGEVCGRPCDGEIDRCGRHDPHRLHTPARMAAAARRRGRKYAVTIERCERREARATERGVVANLPVPSSGGAHQQRYRHCDGCSQPGLVFVDDEYLCQLCSLSALRHQGEIEIHGIGGPLRALFAGGRFAGVGLVTAPSDTAQVSLVVTISAWVSLAYLRRLRHQLAS